LCEVLTFEEFAAQRGLQPDWGDAGMHSGASHVSKTARKRHMKMVAKKDEALTVARERLREVYQTRVDMGLIRQPSHYERIRKTAMGHPDNQSVQAARRILKSRYGEEI
jgi:hypothetical protein